MTKGRIVKNRRRRNGFSLLEAICALFVLTTALSALFGGMVLSARSIHNAEMVTKARFFAEQKLAEVRAGELVPGGPDSGGFPDAENYEWTVEFEPTNVTSLYLARITILWSENRGRRRKSLRVETLRYVDSKGGSVDDATTGSL